MLALVLSAHAASPGPLRKDLVKYPRGGGGDARCQVALAIGVDGLPEAILVSGCEKDFDRSTRESYQMWRWEPEPKPIRFWQRYEVKFAQSAPYAKVATTDREPEPFESVVTSMHHKEVGAWEGAYPGYPSKADGSAANCKAKIWIRAETGQTEGVSLDDCDEIFHGSARRALLDWTWPVQPETKTPWVETVMMLDFEKPPAPTPLTAEEWAPLLTIDTQVAPVPPKKWKRYAPTECLTTLVISEEGTISDVEVSGCDELFHAATENAVRRWKWSHKSAPERRWIALTIPYVNPKK